MKEKKIAVLSDILLEAIKCARKLKKEKYFPINNTHHSQVYNSTAIDLSGAYIAGNAGKSNDYTYAAKDFSEDEVSKIKAISLARYGDWSGALVVLGHAEENLNLDDLKEIGKPVMNTFTGWDQFIDLLSDLENDKIPSLIERGF